MEELIKKALSSLPMPIPSSHRYKLSPIQGGCIHNAWRIDLDNDITIFAKTNSGNNFKVLNFEYESLLALRKYADQSFIHIPQPIKLCEFTNEAILFLPWIHFTSGSQFKLGKGLALLHKSSTGNKDQFGWEGDGFIGLNPQIKGWGRNWGEYFVNFRLKPQIKIASKWGLDINKYQKLYSKIESFLNKHRPLPSLVHGDLWAGNQGVINECDGCIYDPASYWADREVDLAMTELFGGFSEEFYIGYKEIWPLPKDFKSRKDIYNLYHIINHANLFGGSYKNQAMNLINKIEGSI